VLTLVINPFIKMKQIPKNKAKELVRSLGEKAAFEYAQLQMNTKSVNPAVNMFWREVVTEMLVHFEVLA